MPIYDEEDEKSKVRDSVYNSIQCKIQGRGPACAPPRKVIDYQPKPTPTPTPTPRPYPRNTPSPRPRQPSPRWDLTGDEMEDIRNNSMNTHEREVDATWREWLRRNPSPFAQPGMTHAETMQAMARSGFDVWNPAPAHEEDQFPVESTRQFEQQLPRYQEHEGSPPAYDEIPPPAYDEPAPNSTPATRRNPAGNSEQEGDDKTPYSSISARKPISDPRGRNPAMEGPSEEMNPQFENSRLPNSKILTDVGNQLSDLQGHYPSNQQGGQVPSIRDSVKRRIAAKHSSVQDPRDGSDGRPVRFHMGRGEGLDMGQNPGPFEPGADEKIWPPTSGQPLDLSDELSDALEDQPSLQPPLGAQDSDMNNRIPADDGMMGANAYGNYYLAGVQGAQGAMKPQNQNVLGLELNKQAHQAQDRKARLERASTTKKGANDHFQANYDFKEKKFHQGRFDSLNKDLTEELASGSTPLGIAAKNKQAINNVRALIAGKKDPNDLNPQEVFEVAKSLDRVLSQGQPTDASTGHLTPNNAGSWIAEAMQSFTNSTKGAQAGEYVKNIAATLDREYEQADQTLAAARNKRLSTVMDLKKYDPSQWGEMMKRHRLEEGGANVKTVGGKQYKKIPGGWEQI
jgi:hypothetical protein